MASLPVETALSSHARNSWFLGIASVLLLAQSMLMHAE